MFGIIGHMRARANRTFNAVEVGSCAAAKRLVRRRDRFNGSSFVKVTNIAGMVLVDSEEVMGLHVAHVVGAQNHAGSNLVLYADIHLNGAWRSEVGTVHRGAQAESEPLVQQRSHVIRIGCGPIKWRVGLVLFLECRDLVGHNSDGNWVIRLYTPNYRTAKCWL